MNDIEQQFEVFKKEIIEINNYKSFTKSIAEKNLLTSKYLRTIIL